MRLSFGERVEREVGTGGEGRGPSAPRVHLESPAFGRIYSGNQTDNLPLTRWGVSFEFVQLTCILTRVRPCLRASETALVVDDDTEVARPSVIRGLLQRVEREKRAERKCRQVRHVRLWQELLGDPHGELARLLLVGELVVQQLSTELRRLVPGLRRVHRSVAIDDHAEAARPRVRLRFGSRLERNVRAVRERRLQPHVHADAAQIVLREPDRVLALGRLRLGESVHQLHPVLGCLRPRLGRIHHTVRVEHDANRALLRVLDRFGRRIEREVRTRLRPLAGVRATDLIPDAVGQPHRELACRARRRELAVELLRDELRSLGPRLRRGDPTVVVVNDSERAQLHVRLGFCRRVERQPGTVGIGGRVRDSEPADQRRGKPDRRLASGSRRDELRVEQLRRELCRLIPRLRRLKQCLAGSRPHRSRGAALRLEPRRAKRPARRCPRETSACCRRAAAGSSSGSTRCTCRSRQPV